MGVICYLVMIALGEMGAYLPHKKCFAGCATRYVGLALGCNWTTNSVNAAGAVQYWSLSVPIGALMGKSSDGCNHPPTIDSHPSDIPWVRCTDRDVTEVFCVSMPLGTRVFGEFEFWFRSIKVIALVGLSLMGVIIGLGGGPPHDRIAFRYWNPTDGPLGTYLLSQVHNGQRSQLLGFRSTLTTTLFSYIGTE